MGSNDYKKNLPGHGINEDTVRAPVLLQTTGTLNRTASLTASGRLSKAQERIFRSCFFTNALPPLPSLARGPATIATLITASHSIQPVRPGAQYQKSTMTLEDSSEHINPIKTDQPART